MAHAVALLVIATSVSLAQDPAEPKPGADRDLSALEVVLEDLLSWTESPLEPRRAPKEEKRLLFATEARNGRLKAADFLNQHDHDQWAKLSATQNKLASEAAEDAVSHLQDKEPFKDFKPKNEQIVLWDKDRVNEAEKADLFGRPQVFRANPPGYSKDGRLAIVRLTFPWSGGRHSGYVIYVLEQKDGKWVVLVRDRVLFV